MVDIGPQVARHLLRHWLLRFPHSVELWQDLAKIEMIAEHYSASRFAYTVARDHTSKGEARDFAELVLAKICLLQGDPDAAVALLAPHGARATTWSRFRLAQALRDQGRFEEARAALERLGADWQGRREYWWLSADVLQGLNDVDDAQKCWARAGRIR